MDGQEESWQSDLLQRLEDRARQRLWEAGIPLTQSKDDAGKTSRPRLVFTLNLHRTECAHPDQVNSQVYQRVRLWRDSAKEL